MPKITYPFAALPNHVIRGGHGIANIAVLAAILSHGRCDASATTLAREIGCDRKTIFAAIDYWTQNGGECGVQIKTRNRMGRSSVREVHIEYMKTSTENGTGKTKTRPKNGTGSKQTRTENGTGVVPKTVHPPVPKTVHKEEPFKKNKDITLLHKQTGEIINIFKRINPTINFGHKTHRTSVKRMIDQYGYDIVERGANAAVNCQGEDYSPVITTPTELLNKWAKLAIFYKRNSNKDKTAIIS